MHGIKGIGFELHGAGDYDGKFPLMQADKMQTKLVNMVPFYQSQPLVQQAMADLSKQMEARLISTRDASLVADSQLKYSTVSSQVPKASAKGSYREIPVYKESLITARSKGEADLYRADFEATRLCAEAFNQSYEKAYSDRKVPEFLSDMADKYGMERCKVVLASTIQLSPKDGRYSEPVKQEAAKVIIPDSHLNPEHDRRQSYRISCHPVTVNVAYRQLMAMEKNLERDASIPKSVPKKPSILGKLRANQASIAANTKKPPQVTHDKAQRS